MKFFKNIFYRLLGISKTIADFVLPILLSEANAALSRLLPKALEIVSELSKDKNITNVKKRQLATQKLLKWIKEEGITVAENTVNLSIELAVGKTKLKE